VAHTRDAYRILVTIVKEGDDLEDLSVDGRIILKEIYRTSIEELESTRLAQYQVFLNKVINH
jgi:hypothetical protein